MLVSVNTDDPKMFNTSLDNEYLSLIESFGIMHADVIALAQNAISSLWCSNEMKESLNAELTTYANKKVN